MRLTFVKFSSAVEDPGARGGFERLVFKPGVAPNGNTDCTLERLDNGDVVITAPSGLQNVVSNIPYYCRLAPVTPVAAFSPSDEPVTVVERRTPSVPPVAQPQGHPRDKNKNLGKIQRKGE
jgi:hypothetical protein